MGRFHIFDELSEWQNVVHADPTYRFNMDSDALIGAVLSSSPARISIGHVTAE